MFNPQAVMFYSAPRYASYCEITPGQQIDLHAELQANGNYVLYPNGLMSDIEKANDILQANGQDKLHRRIQVSHQTVLQVLATLRARIKLSQTEGLDYQAFQQAQIDALTSPGSAKPFAPARDMFIHNATRLLQDLQPFFPDYAVRQLVNPLCAMTLAKQRKGVFVWPDWQYTRYVNIVVGHVGPERLDMREEIYDWADRVGVRINFGVHF